MLVVLLGMESANTELNNWYEILKFQALSRNEQSVGTWSKYKDDLEMTKSLLATIPKKVKHKVMVPIGPKALMRGNIVHTNEFLVNLGEMWFIKRTASQTIEICDRRIMNCDEMLVKLKKEKELILNKSTLPVAQEAFGNEERPEIIEYVTKEEDEEWRKQHRIRERKYRQQLAQLRNKEKKPIETEADLWEHLDELELQEELEDELNRMNAESCSEEDVPQEKSEIKLAVEEPQNSTTEQDSNNDNKSPRVKRKSVSFLFDTDFSDNEPLRLEIKHSSQKPISSDPNSEEINSPGDIYNHYLKLKNKMPQSILKDSECFTVNNNLSLVQNIEVQDDNDNDYDGDSDNDEQEYFENDPNATSVHLNDIIERNASGIPQTLKTDSHKSRKISKFKIFRNKFG